MSDLIRKSAVVATTAALAFGGIAGSAVAAGHGHKGHHKRWSTAKCSKQQAHWAQKTHMHPSKKQIAAERKLEQNHGCPTIG